MIEILLVVNLLLSIVLMFAMGLRDLMGVLLVVSIPLSIVLMYATELVFAQQEQLELLELLISSLVQLRVVYVVGFYLFQ